MTTKEWTLAWRTMPPDRTGEPHGAHVLQRSVRPSQRCALRRLSTSSPGRIHDTKQIARGHNAVSSHIHPINLHATSRDDSKANLIRPGQKDRGASRIRQTGTGTLS
jgi:hypothetical protein